MFTIKECEIYNHTTAAIVNDKAILEECSDLLVSLEEFSTTINNLIDEGKVVELNTLAVLNLAFNNIQQSTGLNVHSWIALESLTEENYTIVMESIVESIGRAIKKTWDTIKKYLLILFTKTKDRQLQNINDANNLLTLVKTLKTKVNGVSTTTSGNKIKISAEVAKYTYINKGSTIPKEILRLNAVIIENASNGEYETYLKKLFDTLVEVSKTEDMDTDDKQRIAWNAAREKLLKVNLYEEGAFKVLTKNMTKYSNGNSYLTTIPYIGGLTCSMFNRPENTKDYVYTPPTINIKCYLSDDVDEVTATEMNSLTNKDIMVYLNAVEALLDTLILHKQDVIKRAEFVDNIVKHVYGELYYAIDADEDTGDTPPSELYTNYVKTVKHVSTKLATLLSTYVEPLNSFQLHAAKVSRSVYQLCNQSFTANSSK